MNPETRRWLAARTPPPPAVFRPWLDRVGVRGEAAGAAVRRAAGVAEHGDAGDAVATGGSGSPRHVEVLAGEARDGLVEVLHADGHDRRVAFRLLEADALITYACEAAADAADPADALSRVLDRIAGAEF